MLLATSLAALLASPAVTAGIESPATHALPAMTITVSAGPEVSPTLVTRLLKETEAVWRNAGFSFVWRRTGPPSPGDARVADGDPHLPSSVHVVIGDDAGASRHNRMPLGWIVFDDDRSPQQEIYLSHANAWSLMEAARPVVGIIGQMPVVQREILLARALGRALAHELGHYLLASKVHTRTGLLRASRTASELFSPDLRGFAIDAAQRQSIAARMQRELLVASRHAQPPPS